MIKEEEEGNDHEVEEVYNNNTNVPQQYSSSSSYYHNSSYTKEEDNTQYYRVVYKGIIALVAEPSTKKAKSGAYISYGDIFSASTTATQVDGMICVDHVWTGGYALDANSTCGTNFGFVPTRLVEALSRPPLQLESKGPYYYQILAPVPIVTGPMPDAPLQRKKCLSPNTIVEISTKLQYALSTNVYLKMAHYQGCWIVDDSTAKKIKQLDITIPTYSSMDDNVSFTTSTTTCSTEVSSLFSSVASTIHKKKHYRRKQKIKSSHNKQHHSPQSHHHHHQQQQQSKRKEDEPACILMKVLAPEGLKLLDAPQFQVTQFLRHTTPSSSSNRSTNNDNSKLSVIFPTTHQNNHHPKNKHATNAVPKKRILPQHAYFEALKKMGMNHGNGVIPLADHTGWAIVPNASSQHYQQVGVAYTTDKVWVRILPSHGLPTISSHKPKKQKLPCGMCVLVDEFTKDCQFVRLCDDGQWIPRYLKHVLVLQLCQPNIQNGSYWFRVSAINGIDVKRGPSMDAPNINVRFECGEFLRASQIVSFESESYCKLYRNHNNSSIWVPSEWVPIHCAKDQKFLVSESIPPKIVRKSNKYEIVKDTATSIGPSFKLPPLTLLKTNTVVYISEIVIQNKDDEWLRLKDGSGWIHNHISDPNVRLIKDNHNEQAQSTTTHHTSYTNLISRFFPTDSKK